MGALGDPAGEPGAGLRDGIGMGDARGIEAFRRGEVDDQRPGGVGAQKSRSA